MKFYSKKLAFLGGLVLSTRLLTGAVHVLFLMQRGLSLQDLAMVQILCSTTILLVGYPAGLLADLKGSKLCVLLSLFCYTIYYPCCLMAPNMIAISLGSIFYSFGLATFQTTFQTWLVQMVRNEYPNQPQQIDYFTHLNAEYSAMGNMIFTPLAAIFASSIHLGYENLYFIAMGSMIVLLIIFSQIPCFYCSHSHSKNLFYSIQTTLDFCRTDVLARYFLFYSALYAAVFQLVHHFWQPLFVNLNKDQGLSSSTLTGILFFFVSLGQYLSNRYVRYIFTKKTIYWEISMIATFLAFLFFLGVGNLDTLLKVGVCYALIHACLMIGEAVADHQLMKTFSSAHFASLYSLKGVVGRIGALLSLSFIKSALNLYSIQELYRLFSVLVASAVLPLYFLRQHSKKTL